MNSQSPNELVPSAYTNRAHREWAGSELVYNQHHHHHRRWDVVVTLLLHRLTGCVKEWGGLNVVDGVWCSLNAPKPSSSSCPFDVETEMNFYLFSGRDVSIIEKALEIAAIFSHTNQRAAAHNSRKIVKTECESGSFSSSTVELAFAFDSLRDEWMPEISLSVQKYSYSNSLNVHFWMIITKWEKHETFSESEWTALQRLQIDCARIRS